MRGSVNEYVRIVRDKSLLRQLADAGSEIQQNALEAHAKPPALPSWRSSAFTASGRDVKLRPVTAF